MTDDGAVGRQTLMFEGVQQDLTEQIARGDMESFIRYSAAINSWQVVTSHHGAKGLDECLETISLAGSKSPGAGALDSNRSDLIQSLSYVGLA
ncbi:hypothetical protein NC652_033064 [Populus alba x Populus x berolinensis]|nr:hypothetical protein NC652_033064 [Populus alba x Populus x berolinensis]